MRYTNATLHNNTGVSADSAVLNEFDQERESFIDGPLNFNIHSSYLNSHRSIETEEGGLHVYIAMNR